MPGKGSAPKVFMTDFVVDIVIAVSTGWLLLVGSEPVVLFFVRGYHVCSELCRL